MDTILVIDDEDYIRSLLMDLLRAPNRRIIAAASASKAIEWVEEQSFDLILTDIHMPDLDGFELIRRVHQKKPNIPIITITAYASTDSAIEALRAGAYDYITKPFVNEELVRIVENALRAQHLFHQVNELRGRLSRKYSLHNLIGQSRSMQKVFETISQVARTQCNVLITGESGTGKELVAQAIHQNSERCDCPFVPINCASIPLGLLESELFGHVKGAFTGAIRDKQGLIQTANGGTLFLDEIGDMSLDLQVKLLRVIQTRQVQKVGDTDPESVDIRFITATNQDLKKLIEENKFRKDLYYRINVVEITLPPLRQRGSDISLLASHFLKQYNQKTGKTIRNFSPDSRAILERYTWPGNVRELENAVEHAVTISDDLTIQPHHLPIALLDSIEKDTHKNGSLDEKIDAFEKQCITAALTMSRHDVQAAAEILQVSIATLYRKLKKHKIKTGSRILGIPASSDPQLELFPTKNTHPE